MKRLIYHKLLNLGSLRHLDLLWASIQDLLSWSLRDLAIRTSGKLPSLKNVNNLHGYFHPQYSFSHMYPQALAFVGTLEENALQQNSLGSVCVGGYEKELPTDWQGGAESMGGQNQQ